MLGGSYRGAGKQSTGGFVLGDYLRDNIVWHRRCADVIDQLGPIWATCTGSANAYILTTTPSTNRVQNGQRFAFLANHNCTGAITFNVNGTGVKDGKTLAGAATATGDVKSGIYAEIVYSAAADDYLLIGGGSNTLAALNDTAVMLSHTAAITANNAMTATADATIQFRYNDRPLWRDFQLGVAFTIGGTPSTTISISVPSSGTAMAAGMTLPCAANDGDGAGIADARWYFTGSQIDVFKAGLTNWTTGANAKIFIDGKIQR